LRKMAPPDKSLAFINTSATRDGVSGLYANGRFRLACDNPSVETKTQFIARKFLYDTVVFCRRIFVLAFLLFVVVHASKITGRVPSMAPKTAQDFAVVDSISRTPCAIQNRVQRNNQMPW
jgi:hypothetical protein